ncbi:hypothetical protein QEN19_001034 [Hanseniaspora menglaensis]
MGKNSKDKRDVYYRKAKEEGYRARSAYKLLQIDEQFDILSSDVKKVVDLCAAPGSWSQVLSKRMFTGIPEEDRGKKIVAVDLQSMTPIDNIICLKEDITAPSTLAKILALFDNEKTDLVISDGAPDVTGIHDLDEYIQHQLILAALQLGCCILKEGSGKFVVKLFRGKDCDHLYAICRNFFEKVYVAKPRSSRATSSEAFLVGIGFKKPVSDWEPKLDLNKSVQEFFEGVADFSLYNRTGTINQPEFIACGDLAASFDSDATYDIPENFKELDPVQSPKNPAYQKALELKRSGKLKAEGSKE